MMYEYRWAIDYILYDKYLYVSIHVVSQVFQTESWTLDVFIQNILYYDRTSWQYSLNIRYDEMIINNVKIVKNDIPLKVNVFIVNNKKNRVDRVYIGTTIYIIILRHVLFIIFLRTIFIIPATRPAPSVILGKNKTSC